MSKLSLCGIAFLSCFIPSACSAEVKSSAADYFVITIENEIDVAPDDVWVHLIDIGSWWNSDHTWSGNSRNLTLKPAPGGGFDETLPDTGGFVRHMTVIYAAPGKMLRLSGILGPLQEESLNGTMTIQLDKKETNTVLKVTYKVSGHFEGGLDKIAPIVDKVLKEQFTRLAEVTTGREKARDK